MIVQSFEASLLSATMPKIWPKMKKCLNQLSINLFPIKPPKPIFWVPDLAQLLMVLSVYVCFFLISCCKQTSIIGIHSKVSIEMLFRTYIIVPVPILVLLVCRYSVGQSYEITTILIIIIAFCKTLCRLELIF